MLSYIVFNWICINNIYFFHRTTCESTCDTLLSSAAKQGWYTVSVTQGGTAISGATKQLLSPDRVFKRIIYIYIYIYTPDKSKAEITLDVDLDF